MEQQLACIAWLDRTFAAEHLDYWLFGGWAVDVHAGRVTRPHDDIDVAVWQVDLVRADALLTDDGWVRGSLAEQDGYAGYHRGG
ncbi:MAG: hypothetical protein GIW95_08355, partial [Candidatus Eremiobacteraeota bacterium]|nr:hypothetical protein [Candidatus Eremiobacteraeota bacterium]